MALKVGDIIVHKDTKERFKVIKIEKGTVYIDDVIKEKAE
jgi:hypothetical protein